MFNFLKKEVVKPFQVPEYIVFNIENFNNWFNDKNNNAVYAHPGIFLRTDKLSESHITDYLEKCYGITKKDNIIWSESRGELIRKFYNELRNDWRNKNGL